MRERIEALIQRASGEWIHFENPVRVVECERAEDVRAALTETERLTRDYGFHAVGFVGFEAGGAFGLAVSQAPSSGLPMVWFACFEPSTVRTVGAPVATEPYALGDLRPSLDRSRFDATFSRITAHIADGSTNQVNYTFRLEGTFSGHARSFFADLVAAGNSRCAAYLAMGSHAICSASPELLFACDGARLISRPMTGTSRRGRTLAEDTRARDELRSSERQRAKNGMIVDVTRDDMGKIADLGSVEVPEPFNIERSPNAWHMTSQVTARSLASLPELFEALHPPASVTGAPKARTMELLRDLEGGPRGIHTGAIGYLPPDGNARFNVAVRTAVVDHGAGTVAFGVGRGIVRDLDPAAEYEACLFEASVLGQRPPAFELLETLRWAPKGGFLLLDRHLDRMEESAEYFGFAYARDRIRASLNDAVGMTDERKSGPLRLRLLLSRSGDVRVEQRPLEASQEPVRLSLAADPIDSRDVFLFHKTTNRGVYDRARKSGSDDVVLWNAKHEITETTTANIVVEIKGKKITPPIESALLGGTYRAEMLAKKKIREGVVTIDQLRKAKRIWVINSVREWLEAELVQG